MQLNDHPDNAYINAPLPDHRIRCMSQFRPSKKRGGKVKIEIEVSNYVYEGKGKYKRNRIFIDTNIWVDPKNWNNKTGKLSKREENYEYKNNIINQTYGLTSSYVHSKGQQDIDQAYVEGVSFENLRQIFPNRKENRQTFFDYMVKYRDYRKTDGKTAENTIRVINTVCNRIKAFDDSRQKKTYIEDVNYSWSDDFNVFCTVTKKYNESTIHRTYQVIKGCLKYYWKRREELNLDINEAFRDSEFSYGSRTGNQPHALSYEQRDIIFKHKFDKPYLEKARKMICIQSYTGCRYSDIKRFTSECFKKKGKLIYTPKKTQRYKIVAEQPLHPNAEKLFKEVNYDTTEEYTTSSQKYNDYIKDIFKILRKKYPKAQFDEEYSSHNFRDTFISICVKKGVNFKSLLKWVAQKKYETLDTYIDLDDEFEKSEMSKTI